VNPQELEVDDGLGEYEDDIDTPLTTPRTQYDAKQRKAETENRLRYAAIARPCKPLQRMNHHS
jgi:hypothetical protein